MPSIKLHPPSILNIQKCTQKGLSLPDINITIPEPQASRDASIIIVSKTSKHNPNEELF